MTAFSDESTFFSGELIFSKVFSSEVSFSEGVFSGFVLSEEVSGLSIWLSVLCRRFSDDRLFLALVGVFIAFPLDVSPFLTFLFLVFLPLAALFLQKDNLILICFKYFLQFLIYNIIYSYIAGT